MPVKDGTIPGVEKLFLQGLSFMYRCVISNYQNEKSGRRLPISTTDATLP